jgi:hypothetical protein
MLDEIMFMSEKSDEIHLSFLVMISFFKDEFPWIYEIGKETYEILKSSKSISAKEKALSDFRRVIKYTFRHPIFMEMSGSKESFMMMEDLMMMSDKFFDRMIRNTKE